MDMFYYLSDDKNKKERFCGEFLDTPELNKWIRIDIENASYLKEELVGKTDFAQLFSLFEKKIKKTNLIDFFCDDKDYPELKIISTILKHMRDTKGLYITII
jgi:hypothetical protein